VEVEVAYLGLWPEQGSGERGSVYPCGWQVGQGSPLGPCTHMVNGGEGREELGKILLDLDHACSGLLFLLLFFQIF
jgi:hypothetical protein